MKRNVLILFLIFFISPFFAKSYPFEDNTFLYCVFFNDFANPGFKFSFSNKSFKMDIPEKNELLIEEGKYINETKDSLYSVEEKEGFIYLYAIGKKFLVLYYKNILCALVDCSDNTTYFGVNEKSEYVSLPDNPKRIRYLWIGVFDSNKFDTVTSSYLKENGTNYDNKNPYSWQLKTPWVEGKTGSGIGEWIEKKSYKKTNKIILLNGFVDPNHPDYFTKNERIKDFDVFTNENCFHYTLRDTAQLQIIELPDYYSGNIKVQIKSVYDGIKYKDTCLSLFLFLAEKDKQ